MFDLTGSLPSQCAWVKKLGADECLDYRSSTFNEDLVKATDGYVNVYFDNVRSSFSIPILRSAPN